MPRVRLRHTNTQTCEASATTRAAAAKPITTFAASTITGCITSGIAHGAAPSKYDTRASVMVLARLIRTSLCCCASQREEYSYATTLEARLYYSHAGVVGVRYGCACGGTPLPSWASA